MSGCLRGAKPLFLVSFPLSLEGEGDKGGEGDTNINLWVFLRSKGDKSI